jgi:hypothetical protein
MKRPRKHPRTGIYEFHKTTAPLARLRN